MRALVAALLLALAGAAPATEAERPLVATVELRLPPGEDPASLKALVAVEAGRPLSLRALRRTVEALYELGRFGNVVARTVPAPEAPGQVVLVVECLPRRSVASVAFTRVGPGPDLDEERLRRAAGLAPGDELWPRRLDEVAGKVREALARRGYRSASVQARADGEQQAAVVIRVEPGPPTLVGALDLGPAPGLSPARLREGLATRPGAVLDLDALEADVRALRARLRREGFLRARVGVPALTMEGERARVAIPVEAGGRIELRFTGQAAFGAPELRGELGLESDQALDAPAVEAAAGRVRAFYLAHGHAEARVSASEVRVPGGSAVVFQVEEGRRYRVREVRFPDATQRDPAWLRARLDEALERVAPADTGGPDPDAERLVRAAGSPAQVRSRALVDGREVWNPPVWDAAVQQLVEAYRADGYLDAAHEGTRVTLDARAGLVDVEIRLREGVRTRVESVAFEGNRALALPELLHEARLAPGDPLAFAAVESTRGALLALYGRRGHLYARVTDAEELSPDHTRATVRFQIEEGPQVKVGTVRVSGARRTRDDIVREQLSLRSGDVFDPDAAARSQAALLRLGVFRSVGLRLADPDQPAEVKDLTVELAERPWRTLAPGIGFSLANGPRAFVELVQPNLFGRALELSARGKVNYPLAAFRADASDLDAMSPIDRVEGRAEIGLHDPRVRLLGLGVGARVDGIAERLHRLAYDLSRGSVVFGLDFPWTSRVTLSLQYELEVDHIQKRSSSLILTRVDVERLRFPQGVTTLQSVRPVLALDFRDSSVHPRRGWLATGIADYVHSIGAPSDRFLFGWVHGSDVYTNMLKLSGTLSGYLPIATQSVLALSLRAGRVLPLDPTSQTIGPKRFFLGGASTMRGYGEDELIPEDRRAAYLDELRRCAGSLSGVACSPAASQLQRGQSLVSEGGESFLLAKAELRFPLRESVEAGVFADMGNLWLDPRQLSVADLHLNFGVGLRFLTPIGPAVLDVGFNASPDRRLGESYWSPHFSIGLF